MERKLFVASSVLYCRELLNVYGYVEFEGLFLLAYFSRFSKMTREIFFAEF